MKYLKICFILLLLVLSAIPSFAIPNPAAVYCNELGYKYEIVDTGWGEQGICIFSGNYGDLCDEWDFFEGRCGKEDGDELIKSKVMAEMESFGGSLGTGTNPPTGEFARPVLGQETLPGYLNWNDPNGNPNGIDCVTEVKNQGGCGSCWAFATVGAVEASYKIFQSPRDLDLSEQDLVSCDEHPGCCGCEGSWCSFFGLPYVKENGVVEENCFNYHASDIPCSYKPSECSEDSWYIKNYGEVPNNIESMKEYLNKYGPLTVCISSRSLDSLDSRNVYSCTPAAFTDHAVLLVGYNDTGKYWILKNSDGNTWGPDGNGFFKIEYGSCYIEGDTSKDKWVECVNPNIRTNCGTKSGTYYVDTVYFKHKAPDSPYCQASTKNGREDKIRKVSVAGQEKTTNDFYTYSDLTKTIFAYLEKGKTYNLEIEIYSEKYSSEYMKAWIDFNDDKTFSGDEEINFGNNQFSGTHIFTKEFTVPSDTIQGNIRMRVYLSRDTPPEPCEERDNGQVKDYALQISDKISPCGPIDGSIILDRDVYSEGTCFEIQYNDITIDCNGHKIIYANSETGYAVDNSGFDNIVVKNCEIVQKGTSSDSYAVYFHSGAEGGIIENNEIDTSGDRSYGIYMESSNSNKILDNIITTRGTTNSHGIYLSSSDSDEIIGNTITTEGANSNYGIYLYKANSNKITNNNVSTKAGKSGVNPLTSGSQQHDDALHITQSHSNEIKDNKISCSGYNSKGLVLQESKDTVISNNDFESNSDSGKGIYLISSSSNQLTNNKIHTNAYEDYGISLLNADSNTITQNTINTSGEGSRGIFMDQSDTNSINENTIRTSNGGSHGVELLGSSSNSLTENSITTSGISSGGIRMDFSDNNNLYGNNIDTSGVGESSTGIYTSRSDSVNITENSITTSGMQAYGIYSSHSSLNKIHGNDIKTSGEDGLGVLLNSFSKSDIADNEIITKGQNAFGIEMRMSSNSSICANNIKTSGESSNGLSIIDSNTNNITKNAIITSGNFASGIILSTNYAKTEKNSIIENIINTSGSSSFGIIILKVSLTNITSNAITTSGEYSKGLLVENSTITNIDKNAITTSGEQSTGISLSTSDNNSISDNKINTKSLQSYGIFLGNSKAVNLTKNEIRTSGEQSLGIYAYTSSDNILFGNNINTSGKWGSGIYLYNSQNLTITENKLNTEKGYAVYIYPAQEKKYYNHTIDETNTEQEEKIKYYFDEDSILVEDGEDLGELLIAFSEGPLLKNLLLDKDGIILANTKNACILNSSVLTPGTHSLSIIYSNNTNITNSELDSNYEDLHLNNAENVIIINTTYSDISIENSDLHRYWYLDIFVTDTVETPIENAEITCQNKFEDIVFSELTNLEGKIKQKTLLEYNQTGGAQIYSTPYLINATKQGYEPTSTETELKKSEEIYLKLNQSS